MSSKRMMADQDGNIVQRVLDGDVRAYRLLVERYQDRALTLSTRILRNRQEAEETVQDAFVRAYRSLDRYRGEAKFGTWFYRIVYNLCLTALRNRKHAPERVDFEEEVLGERADVQECDDSLADEIEARDILGVVTDEMMQLPVAYRTVMTLFYIEDLSYEEVAQVLGAPLGTVKTNLFRGREALRCRVQSRLEKEVKAA
jgi:RNA polymerase sigma-70 factor, ECF subfamily